jgi:hypothetical protein
MPWLSARKLYTKKEILAFLLRAGQLAHLEPKTMEYHLDSLYSRKYRNRHDTRNWRYEYMSLSVPDVLVALERKGTIPKLYHPHVALYFSRTMGSLCTLCWASNWDDYEERDFRPEIERFICPSMFGIVDLKDRHKKEMPDAWLQKKAVYLFPSPLCKDCKSSLHKSPSFNHYCRLFWHEDYAHDKRSTTEKCAWFVNDAVSWMLKRRPDFVERIQKHKAERLRFYPRYAA